MAGKLFLPRKLRGLHWVILSVQGTEDVLKKNAGEKSTVEHFYSSAGEKLDTANQGKENS